MQTIMIASEKMTQLFREYESLFVPFLKDGNLQFCHWNEEGPDLETALPDLAELLKKDHSWKAVVVHDPGHFQDADGNEIFDEYNPYDYACNDNEMESLAEESPVPLIRLTHMLAGYPQLGIYNIVEKRVKERKKESQIEYEAHMYPEELVKRHQHLTEKYGELLWKPSSLILVSIRRRREHVTRKDLNQIWETKMESESSLFWRRNHYPDICRFICFDVKDTRNDLYTKDLFQFWMTILTLVNNQIPPGALQAYRLYKISCSIDQDQLETCLTDIYSRLFSAKETVDTALKTIPLPDIGQDESVLTAQNVPVVFENVNMQNISIDTRNIGLSRDCPQDEAVYWQESYKDIKNYLKEYVREPRRAINDAAIYTRSAEESFYDMEYHLDDIQKERLQDEIRQLEEDILSSEPMHLVDLSAYEDQMQEMDEQVHHTVEGRMKRKTALIAGGIVLIVCFASFLPYLAASGKDGILTFLAGLKTAVICTAVLAGIGLLALAFLRERIKNLIDKFNSLTLEIITNINEAASAFGEYLSLICTYMKAQSMISGSEDAENSEKSYRALLRMHKYSIEDAIECIQMWATAFDMKLSRQTIQSSDEFYEFDRMPAECPIYYMKINKIENNIKLFGNGYPLTAPYDFVSGLKITREEIYEKRGDDKI